jgi:hypothetical protein
MEGGGVKSQTVIPSAYSEPIQAAYCFHACHAMRHDCDPASTRAGTVNVMANKYSPSLSVEDIR